MAGPIDMKRIVFATGGTGGHIFPALAVAREIIDRGKNKKIYFMGGRYGQESFLIPAKGFDIYLLPIKGFLGRGLGAIPNFFRLGISMVKCFVFLKRIKPHVVVGFGGYASFVPVYMATWLGIPTAIHEQNSLPGVSNKILAKRVDRIFLTFPDEEGMFDSSRVVITGNPIRKELLERNREMNGYGPREGRGLHLLIFGGSQGARGINDAVIESLPIFKDMGVKIYHQTGKADLERVKKAYEDAGIVGAIIVPFIEDMGRAYGWSHLVICRSGASTIAELTALGKPSILIPFPHATHNHQRKNAYFLEKAGAAIMIEQGYLRDKKLGEVVYNLASIPGKLAEMGKRAERLGRPEAAIVVAREIEKMI